MQPSIIHWSILLTTFLSRPVSAHASKPLQQDWRTEYERSNFLKTGRYAEAMDYCKRLEKASPWAKMITFGTTPEGRPMIALVLSRDRAFTPEAAVKSAKPLVMINNGIHAGEIEGKDASLILAREIAVTKKEAALLDHANILIIPVFNVDGHERFGPGNRINQNGPEEMGWRATAQNLNLNRDWTKADAPEMKAMLRLIHAWKPDFFFDDHTTDGADWQYAAQLCVPTGPNMDPGVAAWARAMMEHVQPAVEKDGFLLAPYFGSFDSARPERTITVDDFGPRYSTGYLEAINRPSMLVETHMLKPYKFRVETTYCILRRTIEEIGRTGKELRAITAAADEADRNLKPGTKVTLTLKLTGDTQPYTFRGWKYTPYKSEITGAMVPAWEHTPVDTPSTIRDQFVPELDVVTPAAYAVPPGWTEVIERLTVHGFHFTRLAEPVTEVLETIRLESPAFARTPFEGRFAPTYEITRRPEPQTLPAGTLIVPSNQPGARLLMHLLEPEAPDSFVKWGLFNTIFEQKEYFESYAMEPIAKKMLDADPKLKAEFDERMKDPAFERSPRARLEFFFSRSPYADQRLNRYPVVRLRSAVGGAKQ